MELSVNIDNAHTWGVWEGLREVMQNALDNPNGMTHVYSSESRSLTIMNPNTTLERKVFLMGYSAKRGDDSTVGRHGDGIVSGIVTLVRENKVISIYNGDQLWEPCIQYSETYGDDVLFIRESAIDREDSEDYKVEILGIAEEEYIDFCKKILQLQGNYSKLDTSKGEVLIDEKFKGKVFVGGIYVNKFDKLKYGYNFKPQVLQLDRDRNTLRSFDVVWETGEMLKEVESDLNPYDMADMLINKSPDIQYRSVPETDHVSDICFEKEYKEKYDGKMLADTAEEVVQLQADGHDNVVYIGNDKLTQVIKKSEGYQVMEFGKIKPKSVSQLLDDYKDKWYDSFSNEMLYDYEDMQSAVDKKTQ